MPGRLKVKILALGKYVPENRVDNEVLSERLKIEKNWILEKSGVRSRFWVTDDSVASMGAKALSSALEKAEIEFEELDLIICASGSYDYPVPSNACLIPRFLGKLQAGIPCWDIDATCLSFITALDTISYLIAAGKYRKVAIISSEISSKSLNVNDIETYTLFGDAAVAAIIVASEENDNSEILAAEMKTYSEGAMDTYVKGGGNAWHPRNPEAVDGDFTFQMNGKHLLKMASEKLFPFTVDLFEKVNFPINQIDLVIPHQASKIGLMMGQKILQLSDDQFYKNLENYGNCIAASIPLALHDAIEEGKVKRGDKVCLLGTGAGFSVGGIILIY